MNSSKPIYMDHHATTPVDPRVLEAMLPYFTDVFGNAASTDHEYGAEASQAVDKARAQIAALIGARSEEIIFTSGATEANNLAILGVARQYASRGNHIITCVTEHNAVLDPCRFLQSQGVEVTYLPVDQQGLIDPDDVRQAIRPNTVLISVMTANNEIGVIAPIAEIGRIAREHEVLFHTDATQAVGHIPVNVDAMNVDLLSMSAHKMYGPKGVGALYVRRRPQWVRLAPILHGGGHERGMRSGTLNVPGIVGFGTACIVADDMMEAEVLRLRFLRNQLWSAFSSFEVCADLNGHATQRLPHNLNIAFHRINARAMLLRLRNVVSASAGSACTTSKNEPSHVILALGYNADRASASLRFGLGRTTSKEDIEIVAEQIVEAFHSLLRLV